MKVNSSQSYSMLDNYPMHHLDGEIDLSALGAALVRRWRWLVKFSLAGLLLGGVFAFQKYSQVELELLVDFSKGPRQNLAVLPSPADMFSPILIPFYQSRYSKESAMLLLDKALIASLSDSAQRKNFIVGEPRSKNLRPGSFVSLSVDVPKAKAADYLDLFEQIRGYLVSSASRELMQGDRPASKDFVQILPLKESSCHPERFLIFGGLAGLVVGIGAALLAGRLENRVFTVSEILLRLGYPLMAKLPPLPWEANSIQAELEQLAVLLDVNLRWYVLSIAESHALVRPLVTALQSVRPELQVDEAAPLLAQPLRIPQADLPRAFLLVVECGFNSPQALSEARRALDQMPHLEAVGLVLVGQPLPPELRR